MVATFSGFKEDYGGATNMVVAVANEVGGGVEVANDGGALGGGRRINLAVMGCGKEQESIELGLVILQKINGESNGRL